MTGPWRAFPMAPVYALLITTALVTVGGALAQNPTRVRFQLGPGLPKPPFSVVLVTERGHRVVGTEEIDTGGEATFVTPAEDTRLCLLSSLLATDGRPRCWLVPAAAKELVIPAPRAFR